MLEYDSPDRLHLLLHRAGLGTQACGYHTFSSTFCLLGDLL